MFKGLLRLQNFFGVSNLKEVDQILLNLALHGAREEWLKDCCKVSLLPRHADFEGGAEFYIEHLSVDDLAQRLLWVVNTLEGEWRLTKRKLYLKEDSDIVYYCLRWSENCKKSS